MKTVSFLLVTSCLFFELLACSKENSPNPNEVSSVANETKKDPLETKGEIEKKQVAESKPVPSSSVAEQDAGAQPIADLAQILEPKMDPARELNDLGMKRFPTRNQVTRIPESLNGPVGDVQVGIPTGAESLKDAQKILARTRWRFKACYNRMLRENPVIAGSMKVQATIDSKGEVVASMVAQPLADPLDRCVAGAFRAIKFAEPPSAVTTITVPIVFSIRK